jgi:acetoin:2,6-dichlorophenolindophenol oxidoreductase subunit alpha
MRVRKDVQDPDAPGDALLVAALEAAGGHLGRNAVAEAACTAEAERRDTAATRRVDRCEQQRARLEVIGRVELHLRVEVAPVLRQRSELPIPLLAQRLLPTQLLGRSLAQVHLHQLTFDSCCVEPPQQTSSRNGTDPRTRPVDDEPDHVAAPTRVRRPKQAGRASRLGWVRDSELKLQLPPVVDDCSLEVDELVDESHEREHRLAPVAKVEQKGTLSDSDLREFFREMLLIRRFEEKVEERFRAGELPGFLHVAIGQEAVAVGVCRALEEGDIIASTHRAHGHTLAKGTTPNELMAELYGKLEGCSHGYGGSMHLYDVERGNMGANAVVAGGLPAIVGAALAFKFRGEPRVGVAFFGDGATNIGTFHESLNLAQLWQVPAVFVCENNHWAESTPGWQHMPIEDISQRAVAYGMKVIKVDGQDVEAVYKATRRALEHARGGKGPVFLAVNTYRLVGHYVGDPQVYRSKEELAETRETQDPIEHLRVKLELSDAEVEEIDREVQEIVDASVDFAKNGTDPKPEDALKNIYA